jgi:hypothetical protein
MHATFLLRISVEQSGYLFFDAKIIWRRILNIRFCGNGDEFKGLQNTEFLSRQSYAQAALCHSFNSKERLELKIKNGFRDTLCTHADLISHLLRIYKEYWRQTAHWLRPVWGRHTHILHCKLRIVRGIPASWPIETGSFRIQNEMQGMRCLYGNIASG